MSAIAGETERVNFRANQATKREAERVMRAMGLNLSDGLNMFLARVAAEHRVPFPLAMTREEVLAPETVKLADDAMYAISKEVSRRVADGKPIARYDPIRAEAYIQYADGRKEYIGG
ncbi:MAG: type II toxin-antitoxin system RelB/DinJ family antitoxin [Propionibacteriaceae bacterium]|nr:type II toxin-antitoxin system RelB/DinJ family antitoxin [Propionibacteriaceae bacterium]